MAHTTSDRLRIAYTDAGAGGPVLLLHGMGSSAQSWHATGIVDALVVRGHRAIAVDARGCGDSEPVTDAACFPGGHSVRDDAEVLDACGVEAAHVAGYSMGAGHALRLALEAPWRVRSLVLGGLGGIALTIAGLFLGEEARSRDGLARGRLADPRFRDLIIDLLEGCG